MGDTSEADRAKRVVLGRIIDGSYPAGLRLPAELELAGELGCGRSTVREALSDLAMMGVVQSKRGSGAVVRDFRREALPAILPAYLLSGAPDMDPVVLATELLRIRSLLATEAVRLACLHAPQGALAPARAIVERWSKKRPLAEQAYEEIALFRAIVGASGVWPAMWLANAYFAPMGEVQALLAPIGGGPPSDYGQVMTRLLDLIEAGNTKAALAHFSAWITRVDKTLLGRLAKVLKPARTPSNVSPRFTARAPVGAPPIRSTISKKKELRR